MDKKIIFIIIIIAIAFVIFLLVRNKTKPNDNTNSQPDDNPHNPDLGESLDSGMVMNVDTDFLTSKNKLYTARFFNNFLTVYKWGVPDISVTTLGTAKELPLKVLKMQNDGNCVLYTQDNIAVWDANTQETGKGNKLILGYDGRVCLYLENQKKLVTCFN